MGDRAEASAKRRIICGAAHVKNGLGGYIGYQQ